MSELQELLARLAELDEPESLVLTAVLRLDGRVERTLESRCRRLRLALKGRRRLAESLDESIEMEAKLLSRLGISGTGIC